MFCFVNNAFKKKFDLKDIKEKYFIYIMYLNYLSYTWKSLINLFFVVSIYVKEKKVFYHFKILFLHQSS